MASNWQDRRVVVTGLGVVTPLGNDVDTFWSRLVAGECGIDRITAFDATGYDTQIAGQVTNFDPAPAFPNPKEVRRTDRYSQFGVYAGWQALKDSGANLNFVIGAAGVNNKVFGAGVAAFNGLFNLDLSEASAGLGDTWTLVDNNTLAESFGATFSVAGFTDLGGDLWQTSANGVGYQFSEVTGVLSVVPVPEPSSMAFLLGGVVALIRRRRKQA